MTLQANGGDPGQASYAEIALLYAHYRRPDPRIAALVTNALGEAKTVLNVGAGTGSYEPAHLSVTPVEPSAAMRAQRPAHLTAALGVTAEALPFADNSFDASMSTFSVHQWRDLERGLSEMRRVTRGPVVILTCDPTLLNRFWLSMYTPEVIDAEARRYPSIGRLAKGLGSRVQVLSVPIPLDCTDGFNEAYYGRPAALLDRGARLSCSAWSFVDDTVHDRFTAELSRDLADGTWDNRFGTLCSQPTFDGSLVLVISDGSE
jgi:SAM-dependent methyltransferase